MENCDTAGYGYVRKIALVTNLHLLAPSGQVNLFPCPDHSSCVITARRGTLTGFFFSFLAAADI